MYLIFLVIALTLAYVFLSFMFSWFFTGKSPTFSKRAPHSMLAIGVSSILIIVGSYYIPDLWIANRFLHAIGGGFMAFFICYLVARDNKLPINTFQFFVISVLTVTSLGVANELAEAFLQHYTTMVFAPTIFDTWLDLASNTTGIILGSICFVPHFKKYK